MLAREFAFEDRDFRFLAGLVSERTGIVLGEAKRDLVYGRLAKRLRQLRLASFREYCEHLTQADGDAEMIELINALTTNHTGFFREPHHFEHLETHLASIAHKPRIRLWSAAASVGAEAYSMAMCAHDAIAEIAHRDVRILATDIDTRVLEKARAGAYPATMADSIPAAKRRAYVSERDGQAHMAEALRARVAFLPLNLLEAWPMKGRFDVIFCRNVVIYFDRPTQMRLFDRLADALEDDGLLYIGHSENLHNVCDRFRLVGKTTYRKER